jgi:hypothetical protein
LIGIGKGKRLQSFEEGPKNILSFNSVSFILTFEFLADHLSVWTRTKYQQLMDICAAASNLTLTYEILFTDFLKKHGISCLTYFANDVLVMCHLL